MTKIFINPGHSPNGKPDPGACGNGLRECDVVLKIGQKVSNYLQAAGCETKLVQVDGLGAIANAANSWKADLFVSIHCNAANGTAHGTETYSFAVGTTGYKLATSIHNSIVRKFPELTNRGVRQANYSVLRNTSMPAVLVETAFIDNVHDAKILVEREDDFARAIACGVTDFLKISAPPDVVDAKPQFVCKYCGKANF